MGFINFKTEPEHKEYIKQALTKRGLKPLYAYDWEIHGPHQGMNYQVYVGDAQYLNPKVNTVVSIYPWGVYEIDDLSDWYKTYPENRITIKNN